jgi:hypothetical protein
VTPIVSGDNGAVCMNNVPPHVEIASELTKRLDKLSPIHALLLGRLAPKEMTEVVRMLQRLDESPEV